MSPGNLQITQSPDSILIAFADGREESFTTDNKKNVFETPMGQAEVKAKWKDGGLVVKRKADERKITETYLVTEDGSLLNVLVEIDGEGPRGPVSFRRVYRPAEE